MLQLLALQAAFWVALVQFRARSREPAWRFALALAAGAALAHAGWAVLHVAAVRERPWALADPTVGLCVLFLPLGVLALAPRRRSRDFLAAALGSLPLALAVARLGCLAAGCCHGPVSAAPWAVRPAAGAAAVHPTPAYEIAGWLALHAAARRIPREWVTASVLVGFGALRLALTPWRVDPPLGPPLVPAEWLASGWVLLGMGLAPPARSLRGRRPPGAPGRPRRPRAQGTRIGSSLTGR